jgi:hypothetical protein
MRVEPTVSRDEVVLQRPEDVRFLVPVFHTPTACAGAVSAFLLRRIAYCAGAYAPGIQEHLFHELNTSSEGGNIDRVQRWFNASIFTLHELGYRLHCRRAATPTRAILDWVRAGRGYRGAMLPTSYKKLHKPGSAGVTISDDAVAHAVGVTVESAPGASDGDLVMIDPWPGVLGDPERGKVPPAIESAHRDRNFHALIYYWTGWS